MLVGLVVGEEEEAEEVFARALKVHCREAATVEGVLEVPGIGEGQGRLLVGVENK